ncbi:helicase associated domain-containing protein [Pseudarthrobacter sp. B4EP4b]|uniref:helicase associated domain-containing protein n=1 Tax=Pseudarthrobacter sp. B4EP4b TaxID=2590664 RepID=UPI0015EF50D2|nr:helicase associated domain-containing protein [Pseudarthrobacter sp. B4EP4b]
MEGRLDGSLEAVPAREWDEQLADYVSFLKENNRVPSQYAQDARERSLCFWLRNQKASLRNGVLLPDRAVKLDELLPDWNSPYRVRPSWEQMLARTVQFHREAGRRPSVLATEDEERSLANWLHRQNATRTVSRDRKHGERIAQLDNALPNWRNRPPGDQERWNSRLEQLVEHVHTHGRFPVMGPSSPPEEYALGKWISVQRYALKKGNLYPERLAKLDELIHGWRRN